MYEETWETGKNLPGIEVSKEIFFPGKGNGRETMQAGGMQTGDGSYPKKQLAGDWFQMVFL
mgnify:CR=1 FL=1